MGILFNITRIKIIKAGYNPHNSDYFREEACFGGVARYLGQNTRLHVKINPVLRGDIRAGKEVHTISEVVLEECEQFTKDVLDAFPNVCTMLEPFVFDYPFETKTDYWKLLAVGSLLRLMEEYWPHITEYHELKRNGIPRDVALLCCSLGSRHPTPYGGHTFTGSLGNLKTLHNFNMVDAYLNKVADIPEKYKSMQDCLQSEPFFSEETNFLPYFKMTPKIYEEFNKKEPDVMLLQQLINGKTYRAIS